MKKRLIGKTLALSFLTLSFATSAMTTTVNASPLTDEIAKQEEKDLQEKIANGSLDPKVWAQTFNSSTPGIDLTGYVPLQPAPKDLTVNPESFTGSDIWTHNGKRYRWLFNYPIKNSYRQQPAVVSLDENMPHDASTLRQLDTAYVNNPIYGTGFESMSDLFSFTDYTFIDDPVASKYDHPSGPVQLDVGAGDDFNWMMKRTADYVEYVLPFTYVDSQWDDNHAQWMMRYKPYYRVKVMNDGRLIKTFGILNADKDPHYLRLMYTLQHKWQSNSILLDGNLRYDHSVAFYRHPQSNELDSAVAKETKFTTEAGILSKKYMINPALTYYIEPKSGIDKMTFASYLDYSTDTESKMNEWLKDRYHTFVENTRLHESIDKNTPARSFNPGSYHMILSTPKQKVLPNQRIEITWEEMLYPGGMPKPEVKSHVTYHFKDTDGNKLKDDITINGTVGKSYNRPNIPTINGYTLQSQPAATGTFKDQPEEFTVVYKKQSAVTVKYVDESGAKIKEDLVLNGSKGDSFTLQTPSIKNYTLKTAPTLAGTMNGQTLKFVYAKNKHTITVKYMNGSTEIAPSKAIKGDFDAVFREAPKTITNYTPTDSPVDGIYGKYGDTLIFHYNKQRTDIKVKFVDSQLKEIAPALEIHEDFDKPVTISAKEIKNYHPTHFSKVFLADTTKKTTSVNGVNRFLAVLRPTVVHAAESDVDKQPYTEPITLTGELKRVEYTIYYEKDSGSATVKYVDKSGKELASPDDLSGEIGSPFTIEPKTIDKYELAESPERLENTFKDEPQTFTFVYDAVAEEAPEVKETPKVEKAPEVKKDQPDLPKLGSRQLIAASSVGVVISVLGAIAFLKMTK